MPYLLMLLFLVPRAASQVTTKLNSNDFSKLKTTGSFLYVLITAIFSLPVFWVANGFSLVINPTVATYAAIYGTCGTINVILTVFMYKFASVTFVNFIMGTVSLIASALLGALILNEEITPSLILQIALMLVCIVTMFVGETKEKKRSTSENKKLNFLSFILPAAYALLSVIATFALKRYTASDNYTDTNSLFFMCNVWALVYVIPLFFIFAKKEKAPREEIRKICTDKRCLFVLLNTIVGSLVTIVSTLLLAQMDVALHAPVISALGYVAIAIATPIVKERLDKYKIAATVIAILSLFLPMIIF